MWISLDTCKHLRNIFISNSTMKHEDAVVYWVLRWLIRRKVTVQATGQTSATIYEKIFLR